MRQLKGRLWRVSAVGAVFIAPIVSGADDDVEVAPQAKVLVEVAEDLSVDRWIFRDLNPIGGIQIISAAGGRARIDSQLKQLVDELVQGCELNAAQQQKLKLAASGDIKLFFDQVEGARKKYLTLKDNRDALNPFYQEKIAPLQMQYSKGLFGEGSMFRKTLRNTLTADQQAKYDDVMLNSRRAAYRERIKSLLSKVEGGFRDNQIEVLRELLLEHTQSPLQYGPYDQQVIMLKLSQLPAAKLKEVLDKDQWKQLQPRLLQASGTEDLLARYGVIEETIQKSPVILRSVRTVVETPAARTKTD
ncbi:MAG: hypothetical protein JWP89_5086 [Schlesneria sp.]|nr:hypothetical protein [Schlesneria sp.]